MAQGNILKDTVRSVKKTMTNPVTRWATLGACSRYIWETVGLYFLPLYFMLKFPSYKSAFVMHSIVSLSVAGIISSFAGGILSDKFGRKKPSSYALINIFGSAFAIPFNLICLMTNNFNVAIACYVLRVLFGELYWSPNVTMLQKSTSSDE